MPDIPIIPLEVLVSEDAESVQVPFPPVEAYEEPEAAPKPEEGVDNWDLRNQVFEQTNQITKILIDRYPVTSSGWKGSLEARGALLEAAGCLEIARKELGA